MNNKPQISFSRWKPIEIMLAVLFLIAPFYYHPNIGGEGLRIPNNITVWMVASIIIFYSLYLVLKRPEFVVPKYFLYIASFPIIISLAGFITGVEQPLTWMFRVLFIWAGLAFLFSLFQHGLEQGRIDRLLLIVVISALLHAVIGIAQIALKELPLWLPQSSTGVPSGLFQQINNHASYQVTAIMIAIYLITRPIISEGKLRFKLLIIVGVLLSSYLVSHSGSRVGMLSLVLGLLMIIPALWSRFKQRKAISSSVLLMLLLGVCSGLFLGQGRAIDKTVAMQSGYSGSARLGIYSISIDLIKQKPLLGHGIGSFPRVWQFSKPDFYKNNPNATLPPQFVTHPHNETIFWLVEGGMLSGLSLLIVMVGIVIALRKVGWHRGGAYAAILLPIGLHTQVELPFYLSTIHWLLFIFLIMVVMRHNVSINKQTLSLSAKRLVIVSSTSIFVIWLLFIAHTLRSQCDFNKFYDLSNIEQEPFQYALNNPYLQPNAQWINMSSILYSSMEQGMVRNVEVYLVWAEQLLLEKPDIDLYKKLADGYYYLGETNKFCKTITKGLSLYPRYEPFQQVLSECRK